MKSNELHPPAHFRRPLWRGAGSCGRRGVVAQGAAGRRSGGPARSTAREAACTAHRQRDGAAQGSGTPAQGWRWQGSVLRHSGAGAVRCRWICESFGRIRREWNCGRGCVVCSIPFGIGGTFQCQFQNHANRYWIPKMPIPNFPSKFYAPISTS